VYDNIRRDLRRGGMRFGGLEMKVRMILEKKKGWKARRDANVWKLS
jgi:hypothetical protein